MKREISGDIIDAIRATRLHKKANSDSISFSSNIHILGYSQGGYDGTAAYLTMSRLYPSEFNVTKLFSGAAPYDVFYSVDYAARQANSGDGVTLPQNMTRQLFRSYLSYSYNEVSDAYSMLSYGFDRTVTVPSEGGLTLSQKFTFADIVESWLTGGLQDVKLYTKLNSLTLFMPLEHCSYDVNPFKGELFLFHHKNDEVIPCRNLTNFLSTQPIKIIGGALCTQPMNIRHNLTPVLSSEVKTVDNETCTSHQDCTFDFYRWALSKILL